MKGYVYLIWNQSDGLFKIGKSKRLTTRLRSHQTGNAGRLGIVCNIASDDMGKLEKRLHSEFDHKRVRGEWFRLSWDDAATIRSLA